MTNDIIVGTDKLAKHAKLGMSTIYYHIKSNKFPKPFTMKEHGNKSVWDRAKVDEWLAVYNGEATPIKSAALSAKAPGSNSVVYVGSGFNKPSTTPNAVLRDRVDTILDMLDNKILTETTINGRTDLNILTKTARDLLGQVLVLADEGSTEL